MTRHHVCRDKGAWQQIFPIQEDLAIFQAKNPLGSKGDETLNTDDNVTHHLTDHPP